MGLLLSSLGVGCRTEAVHKTVFPQLSGNAARLYEKREVISKQENPDSLPSWTSSEPILVIFK